MGGGGSALGLNDCRRRTWPSFAAVWTSFSTLSRTEQLCFKKTQSVFPQQHCSVSGWLSATARVSRSNLSG